MNNLEIYKPPMLSVIEQETKLREIPEEERLMKCTQIVANLLLDLGVGSKSDPQQHLRVIKFLVEDCGKFTVKEVEYAFKLAIQGKLDIDLFQQINVLVVGKVLSAFDDYKKEKLKVYKLDRQKKDIESKIFTEDYKKALIKKAVSDQLNYFYNHRKVNEMAFNVYNIFDKLGFMPSDIDYKKSVKKDAIEILKKEYSQIKALSKEEYKSIQKVMKGLDIGKSDKIIKKCKELSLEDYLRKELKSEEDIARIIKLVV